MRILDTPVTREDLIKSSENFIDDNAIKAAVDIERELIAVDAPMHYDSKKWLK